MKNFGKAFVAVLCLTGALDASANQCLQQATNQELLLEVSRRMANAGGGGDQTGHLLVAFSCEYWNSSESRLNVTLTNLETAQETRTSLAVIAKDQCSKYSTSLTSKHQVVAGPILAAWCEYWNSSESRLQRRVIRQDGSISNLPASVITKDECIRQADAINGAQ